MFIIINPTTEKNLLGKSLPQDHLHAIWASSSPWEEIGQDYACQSSISGSFQARRILKTLPLSTDLKDKNNSNGIVKFSSWSTSFHVQKIIWKHCRWRLIWRKKPSKSKLVFIMELLSMSPGPLVESVEKMWKIQMMDGNPWKVVFTENNSDVKNFLPSWAFLLSLSEP